MLIFVIPTLFQALKSSNFQQDFPSLEKMLKKASIEPAQAFSNQHHLIGDLFDVSQETASAVAAIEQSMLNINGQWSCVASPVIISPNRDHLDLAQYQGLDISEDEANNLCEEFNDYFKGDGFSFSFNEPNRWYCHCENDFNVSDVSPESICGENIAPHIPQGSEGAQWRKIFNETQMLLHHSLTNRQRTQLGKPEINSLWFWGGGRLNNKLNPKNFKVYSNQLYIKGLCQLSGSEHSPLLEFIKIEQSNEAVFIVAETSDEDWRQWESLFFKPALSALQQGKIESVNFHFSLDEKIVSKKSHFLRFWKSNDIQSFINK